MVACLCLLLCFALLCCLVLVFDYCCRAECRLLPCVARWQSRVFPKSGGPPSGKLVRFPLGGCASQKPGGTRVGRAQIWRGRLARRVLEATRRMWGWWGVAWGTFIYEKYGRRRLCSAGQGGPERGWHGMALNWQGLQSSLNKQLTLCSARRHPHAPALAS